jgi:hypothetical protein
MKTSRAQQTIRALIIPATFALACAVAIYFVAGISLGLFLGPLCAIALIAPPLVLRHVTLRAQLGVAAGLVLGTSMVWIFATVRSGLTAWECAQCIFVLIGLVVALWGLAALLGRWIQRGEVASTIAVIIALLWLTWPVWLSRTLLAMDNPGALVAWLAPAHPPLAISAALDLGAWGEQRIAYQLTVLGQDVAYRPPSHVWWAVLVHCAFGAGLLMLARIKTPRQSPVLSSPAGSSSASSPAG